LKFLIDNALSPKLAEGLRQAGYDAVHLRDVGRHDAPDTQVIAIASNAGRIVVSSDMDFPQLIAFRGLSLPSVILFRRVERRTQARLDLLLRNLPQLEADLTEAAS
jgi:predicted nuclease of predicted toxin-antitoxin system